MREASHVTQDAFGQVASAAGSRANVTATVIVVHMGVSAP